MNPIKVISALLSFLFAVLVISLAYTQIVKNKKYVKLSMTNRIRLLPVEGTRGRIFDRNGALLVSSRTSFDAVVIPQELKMSVNTLSRLAQILGLAPEEVFKKVEKNYKAPFVPVAVREDVGKEKALVIEEESTVLPGVIIRVTPRREYKYGEAGSHILGYLGEIGEGELDRLRDYGYQLRDRIGKAGLEKNYDNYLRGEGGGMQLEVDNRGNFIKLLGKKDARYGRDLMLTIDMRLQEFIEAAMAGKTGACVVMEPYTGEVFALASKPDFDPGIFIDKEKSRERADLLSDPGRPMLNRAIAGLYPAGSVFKPVVAAAALEKKRIMPQGTLFCGGSYVLGGNSFDCWDEDGHGAQTVVEGIKNSCNVFFYQLGRMTGADDIYNYAARFGYGSPTGIDLREEAAGLLPSKAWKRSAKKEAWFEGDTLNFSIGQGNLLVTPIQVVRMTAALSNGGILIQPHLVKKIGDIEVSKGKSRDTGVSSRTLDIIKEGMRMVVEAPGGTGQRARVEGLRIAGKTGTAQSAGVSHAWFTGYSPIDNPRLAIVVFLEHGGKGGIDAAELAAKVFAEAKRIGLL
ncbi:MAG: penicillin-binding protein 2 [Candidatus Omnitrophica bacterium]|nr:penicillin-binding protein 2 [Candidatus Omnitrophota bacterium]